MPEQTDDASKAPLDKSRQVDPLAGADAKKPKPSTEGRNGAWRVQARPPRFLVAALPPATPAEVDGLWEALEREPEVRLIKRIRPTERTPDRPETTWPGSLGYPYPE